MRKLLNQVFAKTNDKPDAVAQELADARARNAESASALDDTIAKLLQHNRREPFRPR